MSDSHYTKMTVGAWGRNTKLISNKKTKYIILENEYWILM